MRVTGVATVVMGVAVVLAADVRADDGSFLAAARSAGFTSTDQELLRDGYAACALRAEPGSSTDLVDSAITKAMRFLGRGIDQADADRFVTIALTQLCPGALR